MIYYKVILKNGKQIKIADWMLDKILEKENMVGMNYFNQTNLEGEKLFTVGLDLQEVCAIVPVESKKYKELPREYVTVDSSLNSATFNIKPNLEGATFTPC